MAKLAEACSALGMGLVLMQGVQEGSMSNDDLLAQTDALIAATLKSYESEDDPEWRRNIGFELSGMRRVRAIIAAKEETLTEGQ